MNQDLIHNRKILVSSPYSLWFRPAFILLVSILPLLPSPLIAGEEKEDIQIPEVVITGEDRSLLLREKEKEEEILMPKREKVGLEKELAPKSPPGEIVKQEKRYLEESHFFSSFDVSYGSYNSLNYELFHRQRVGQGNCHIKVGGGYSGGFGWKEKLFGQISKHYLESGVNLYREEWMIEMAVDLGIKDIHLPYKETEEIISAGGIHLSGIKTFSPEAEIGGRFEFSSGGIQKEDIDSTTLVSNLEFNTLVKRLPIGIGTRMEYYQIDSQETNISSLFIQSKNLKIDPFRLDIRAGVDNHHGHCQELNLGLSLYWPWREQGRFSLGYRREVKNPSFKELYLDNEYLIANKDLHPVRMQELRFRGDYQLTKKAFFDFAIFTQEAKDYVVLKEDKYHLYKPTNIDASIWSGQIKVDSYLTPQLTQRSSLTYTIAKSREEGEGIIPHIPDWKINLFLKYFNKRGFEASFNPEYVGWRKDCLSSSISEDLPGYFLVHGRLCQHLFKDTLVIYLYGKNLLDEDYLEKTNYPGWPRLFGGGLIWRF